MSVLEMKWSPALSLVCEVARILAFTLSGERTSHKSFDLKRNMVEKKEGGTWKKKVNPSVFHLPIVTKKYFFILFGMIVSMKER